MFKRGKFLLSTTEQKYELILERLHLKLPEGPRTWREPRDPAKDVEGGFLMRETIKGPFDILRVHEELSCALELTVYRLTTSVFNYPTCERTRANADRLLAAQ